MGKSNVWVGTVFLLKGWLGNLEAEAVLWAWPCWNERECVLAKQDQLLELRDEKRGIWVLEKTLQRPWAGCVEATLCWRSETSLSMEQMKPELGTGAYCWARMPLLRETGLAMVRQKGKSLPVPSPMVLELFSGLALLWTVGSWVSWKGPKWKKGRKSQCSFSCSVTAAFVQEQRVTND